MQLSNWNPFRFKRKKKNEDAEPRSSPLAVRQGGYAALTPFDAMQQMLREFAVESFFPVSPLLRGTLSPTMDANRWFGDFSPSAFQPTIDVVDEGKALRVSVELPGMDQEAVSSLSSRAPPIANARPLPETWEATFESS